MVFVGGWRSRRRRYGPQDDPRYPGGDDPRYQQGYGPRFGYRRPPRGYGGGGGGCLRDLFLIEGGCCLAEMLGCGPQLLLVAPSLLRRRTGPAPDTLQTRTLRARLLSRLLGLIGTYQSQISSRRRPCCTFTPTCSHYAAEALRTHGLGRGLVLTTRRLARCRPGAQPGADPVPPAPCHVRRTRRGSA